MYIHSVSWRLTGGLCGATSPETSAAQTSPPCTSGRCSHAVSYQGCWKSAASMPISARNSAAWAIARFSTMRPPIEQPITTGRSSSMAWQKARIAAVYDAVVSRYSVFSQPSGGVDLPCHGMSNAITRKREVISGSAIRWRYCRPSAPAVCRQTSGMPCPASSK